MEPKTRRALMAVPLIDEQRPPADYIKSIKLKEVEKNGHLGHFMVSPNLNRIVRHPSQPQLQDHMRLLVKKLNETRIRLVQCIGTGSIGFYVFIMLSIELKGTILCGSYLKHQE